MAKRMKKSWKKAPLTVKDYGQKQTNSLLRTMFGETCTSDDLDTFQKKYGFYPFYIRKDPQYRAGYAKYKVPGPEAPLSTYGPMGEGAKVLHQTSPDAGSVQLSDDDDTLPDASDVTPDVSAEDTAIRDQRRRRTSNLPVGAAAFKHDANFSAGDMQTRIQRLQNEASALATVPDKLKAFVPFGDFDLVDSIVESGMFMPVFTTGLSGCGKTLFPEQACAARGREFIQVDITTETDEDDLIGGFRLRNGSTYFELGPVVIAMIRGAVLLVNELDLASPKIMCLQSIIDGKPLTIKKLGLTIKAAPGFTVFATANTKGRGDQSGKYIGTGLLNEAFLERFPIWVEQDYPDTAIETKILQKTFEQEGGQMTPSTREFFKTLAKWSATIREAAKKDASEDVISTRRLCHIVKAYKLFGADKDKNNQGKALSYVLNRFDNATKSTFIDLYNKHVDDAGAPSNIGSVPSKPGNF